MSKNKAKKYCIADGCRNTDKNSDLTFFSLPTQQKDAERTRKWLTLLGREDLLEKQLKKSTYIVCSEHFDTSSIILIKRLKENAVPTLLLANQLNTYLKPEHIAESKEATVLLKSTVTSAIACGEQAKGKGVTNKDPLPEQQAQTSKLIAEGTPREKTLSGKLKECEHKTTAKVGLAQENSYKFVDIYENPVLSSVVS
ncbi:hypothetical protein MSG28_014865 [Choristoneura fumiferana]|uniref:Uncharacterized protein n=1 Tax=Choristoneura fumiferana TaxID=7141 RepID=A0ACC0JSY5_CHOFU|nr:hypothetical protein MSG28_014865 [Choristoneura fumiferana]